MLKNYLFGAAELTKNADPNKYSGYDIFHLMYVEPFHRQIK